MRNRVGRSNSNERGSSYARRARKNWLLSPGSGHGGDAEKAPCWECGAMVGYTTMIVDRIVPGEVGGRYTRANIRIHCVPCSCRQGVARTNALRRASDPYDERDRCKRCQAHFLGQHAQDCPTGLARGW